MPSGYVKDDGSAYTSAPGYGWDANLTGATRERHSASDQRLDTNLGVSNSLAAHTWRYDLANGDYLVTLVSGDALWGHGHRVIVEGTVVTDSVATAGGNYVTVTDQPITVSDGTLTITVGQSTTGSYTDLNYAIITPVSTAASMLPATQTPLYYATMPVPPSDRIRLGGGPFSLRLGLEPLTAGPTTPFLTLIAHGGSASTTISPAPSSTLPGATVTFSWSYTGGNTSGTNVAYKYTGKELDSSTGLYFYEARYYDAALGRFISADTIVPRPGNPQDFNRYTYANNNPILYTDPTGHFGIKSIKKKFRKISKKLRKKLGPVGFVLAGVTLQFNPHVLALSGGTSGLFGTGLLTQSKAGRYTLAGEIIVGTAVASFYCGGCAAASVINGALYGEVALGATGGLSAASNSQDISTGVLIGTVIGGASGAFTGYFAPTGTQASFLTTGQKISLAGKVGFTQGFSEELTRQLAGSGGNFRKLQPLKLGLAGLKGAAFRAARVGVAESLLANSQSTSIVTSSEFEVDGEKFSRISVSLTSSYSSNLRGLADMIQPAPLPVSFADVISSLPGGLIYGAGFDLVDFLNRK